MSNKLLSQRIMPLFAALTIVVSMIFLTPVGSAKADVLCNPQIGVDLNNTEIRVWCFQAETEVALTIDNPATPQNPDYSDSGIVPAGDYPMLIFPFGTTLILKPGYVIGASDGIATRQLIFQEVGISKINTQSNTVSGTAIPFSSVSVGATLLSGNWVSRGAFADVHGDWTVYFNDPNYFGGAVDLQNGMLIDVTQYDSDYDGVYYDQMILPRIEVDLKEPYIMTYGWASGISITLEVDDPLTGQNPDCSLTKTAAWDMDGFYRPNCSVKVGDIVTIKGNNVSASHAVQLLKITKVDVVNDLIRGVANKNQKLSLNMWVDGSEINVETISNADGDWEFDLSGLNPPVDLDVSDYSCQYIYAIDANRNSTVAEFCLFPANLYVDLSSNTIEIGDALLGDLITLTVDDPQTPNNPDFQTMLIGEDDTLVQPPFPIKPGFVVEMAGSASMKQLVVMDLFITSVDVVNDLVYGFTDFPHQVWIDIYSPAPDWEFLGGRDVYPDQNGNWVADFSSPYEWMKVDIQPGYEIYLGQYDNDGDTLVDWWKVPEYLVPILDDFNRLDGPLGSNWLGYKSAYRILGNKVDVRGNGPIYWKDTFGADQEVAVTLTTVDPAGFEQDLLLKVQGQYGPNWGEGAIEVLYKAQTGTVTVWTFLPDTLDWFAYPAIPATFADGDQFGAQALSTGDVVIYKNGMEVGRVTLNSADQAFFNPKGGHIGLWFINARNAFLDDFGGGDITMP